MTAEQLVVLALLAAAFAAGWFARGGDPGARASRGRSRRRARSTEAPGQEPAVPQESADSRARAARPRLAEDQQPASAPAARFDAAWPPHPLDLTRRALALAGSAYEAAVERWVDEGADITPAGRAALGELDRAIRRLDLAASRLAGAQGDHEREAAEARIALGALREAAGLLGGYRDGRPLDAAIDRDLRDLEDEVAQARAALGAGSA